MNILEIFDVQNLDLFSVGIITAGIGILGFIIFFNSPKSITNKTFLFLSLAAAFYAMVNYVSYKTVSLVAVLWLARLVLFSVVWYSFAAFQLSYVFPKEKMTFHFLYTYLIVPLVFFTAVLTLTPFVFHQVELIPGKGIPRPIIGPALPLFGIVVVGLVSGSIFLLFRKMFRSEGLEKIQFRFILLGSLITYSLLVVFNFIFPVMLAKVEFLPLAPVFILPFISFTAYTILRHHLLNIKIIATEIVVFLLLVSMLFEILLSRSSLELVFRFAVFVILFIFSIVLIRSVLKEVRQREELQILTKQLQDANTRLKELDQLKSEFLSFASHQLRSPLTAIRGYASLILEKTFGEMPEKVQSAVDKIYQASHSMITVVEDFLNVSRIEQGGMRFDFTSASLQKIVEGVAGEQKVNAEQAKLNLEVNIEPDEEGYLVRIDAGKIKQVVMNLVDNAVKYTPGGGTILISLKHDLQGRKIVLSIKDTGIGISPDIFPKLFSKFSRAKDASRINIKGTGLGLYIAKEIMNAHKGRIWAESEGEGKGSTFHLEFFTDIIIGS